MFLMDSDEDEDNDYGMDLEDYYDFMIEKYDDIYGNMGDSSGEDTDYDEASYVSRPSESELRHMKRCKSVCNNLNDNRKEGLFCDATISIGNKKFPVHKTILTASSSYFRAMFTGSFTEKNEDCIEIQGVSETAFGDLLDYIYGTELKLSFENIKEIYMAADMLCVDALIEECKLYFKENWLVASAVGAVYEMAKEFEFNDIADEIIRNAQNHLQGFSLKTNYKDLPYDFLCKVLEVRLVNKNLKESPMAETLIEWAFHKPEERLPEQALKLLANIHFEFVLDSDFNLMLETRCISEDCLDVEKNVIEKFKSDLKNIYDKSHALISKHNVEVIVLDTSQEFGINNLVLFNSSSWNWESKSCHVGFKPELGLLKGDQLYLFGEEGGCKVNTQTLSTVKLPPFPVKRTKFAFNVIDNNVYLTGGVQADNNRHLGDILELKSSSNFWVFRTKWYRNKCNAAIISVENCLYIVGGDLPENYSGKKLVRQEVSRYNCCSNYFQKICDLPVQVSKPKLAVYNDMLYVFAENLDVVLQIDLKTRTVVENGNKISLESCPYKILDVCSVDDGVIVAFLYETNILLGLIKPSENCQIQLLGLVSKLNASVELRSGKYFVYLRKAITL